MLQPGNAHLDAVFASPSLVQVSKLSRVVRLDVGVKEGCILKIDMDRYYLDWLVASWSLEKRCVRKLIPLLQHWFDVKSVRSDNVRNFVRELLTVKTGRHLSLVAHRRQKLAHHHQQKQGPDGTQLIATHVPRPKRATAERLTSRTPSIVP